MTAPVPVEIPATYHVGDGLTAAFLIGFELKAGSSVAVTVNEVPQTEGPNYAVVGDQVVFAAPPEDGWHIGFQRRTPIGQSKAFPNQPTMRPQSVEDALSERARVDQELAEMGGRAMAVPIGENGLLLPRAEIRAGKLAAYDGVGAPIVSEYGIADFDQALTDLQAVAGAADIIAGIPAQFDGKLALNGGNAVSMVGFDFDDATAPLRSIGPDHYAPADGVYIGSGSINLSLETFISSPIGAADSDNQRALLALIARTSDGGNSEEQNLLVMTEIGTGYLPEFIPNHAYTVGQEFIHAAGNNIYRVMTAGTSGATAPTGKGSGIANGPNTLVVKWINDAAINAKAGIYNETVLIPGAGSSWAQANNILLKAGVQATFVVNTEFDFTNNTGVDSVLGGRNYHGLYIAMEGANRSTSAVEILSSANDHDALIWGMHFVGSRLASNAIICFDASAPIAIGAGTGAGGVLTPTYTTAFIRDKSNTPVGLWLAGTNYTSSAIAITQNAPSGVAISAANSIAAFLATATGPTGFLGSAANDTANFTANGTTPSGFLAAGPNSSAAFSATGSGGAGLAVSGVRNQAGIFDDSTAPYGVILTGTYQYSPLLFESLPPEFANDAAAATGGLVVGATYRTGSALKLRAA